MQMRVYKTVGENEKRSKGLGNSLKRSVHRLTCDSAEPTVGRKGPWLYFRRRRSVSCSEHL
jgi:hypothetical protein